MNKHASIPDDIKLAPAILEHVADIIADQRAAIMLCQQRLILAGLPADQAGVVATDVFVRLGCEMAMDVALELHDRQPSRDRWLLVCGETFDQVLGLARGEPS